MKNIFPGMLNVVRRRENLVEGAGTYTKDPHFYIAVDTGGTFTDICLIRQDTGELFTAKVPSTPADSSKGVVNAIDKICELSGLQKNDLRLLLHGTTVATNSMLEKKGAVSALITTLGFRDVLCIGRQNRPELYTFRAAKADPLIPRHLIFEINERVLPSGEIIRPLVESEVIGVLDQIRTRGATSVAVCLLHSYINPEHEIRIKEIIHKTCPDIHVSVSSEILPAFREYERACATAINALVQPEMSKYISGLKTKLESGGSKPGIFIMQSSGGVITATQACRESARTIYSGPAGGVLAGMHLSRITGRPRIITADMGGTSTDVSLLNGDAARLNMEGSIRGHPLHLPMLDIRTIGAGGGSIAWIDSGGSLRVGPQSAGAAPGPACYGSGGNEPTVTDANLILGRLGPDISGREGFPLNISLARRCIEEKIARPLGISVEEAAEGIITVVIASMNRAIRLISVQKGHNPQEFTLMAFGGAGPLHAAQMAAEMNIPFVLIPEHPGLTSAVGILFADARRDYLQTFIRPLKNTSASELNEIFSSMEETGWREMINEGFAPHEIIFKRSADLRYAGQSYELNLQVPSGNLTRSDLDLLERRYHLTHQQEYGTTRKDINVELVFLHLAVIGRLPRSRNIVEARREPTSLPAPTLVEVRKVFYLGRYIEASVYSRDTLPCGIKIDGPVIVTQPDTSTLIWPGMSFTVDKWGNLIIDTGVK